MSEDQILSPTEPAKGLEQSLDQAGDELSLLEYSKTVEDLGRDAVSVVIPVENHVSKLPALFKRIVPQLGATGRPFEIIVVDDRSQDETMQYLTHLPPEWHVRPFSKQGKTGRSISIKEGTDQALASTIVLLDPDTEYSPEAMRGVIDMLQTCDIAVVRRRSTLLSPFALLRSLQRLIFGQMVATNEDVRSGLKAFKRSLLESMRFDPESETTWGLDAFLLYHAQHAGLVVGSVDAAYARHRRSIRRAIKAHMHASIGIAALRVMHVVRKLLPFLFPPAPVEYFSAGFTNINDYLFLTPTQSAKGHVTKETISLLAVCILAVAIVLGVLRLSLGVPVLRSFAMFISVTYLSILLFRVAMLFQSVKANKEKITDEEVKTLRDDELPVITILIPLYKEQEIIPQIFRYLSEFDYPQEKLDIIFILESSDPETSQAFLDMHPPANFKALLSPDIEPKTKPKAMNVALKVARGDVLVIFDAEVLPEKDQLKRAVVTFKKYPDVKYLHGRMDVYNADENWITRLYTAEFCYFYHYLMPGFIESGYPVPISGHSTYFRREVIESVGAWDAYNVAEDCDIGIRIYRKGFGNGMMLDSHTWEQSTMTLPTWVRQRTRWIQGFVQTSMVQLRYPLLLKRELKSWKNFCAFLFLVPGNVILNFLNIIQWVFFILWHTTHAPFLQSAYSGLTLYLATTNFIVGNFLFTFFAMYGLYMRNHFRIVPWAVLSFVYWIMLGIASIRSTWHLFLHPHKWDKTKHFVASNPPHA